ncbi:MAG TPA: hypothetical protein VHC19_09905 [Pirellulales bacterium]|nr:hypothetical protein [Pirellulales bacterium]
MSKTTYEGFDDLPEWAKSRIAKFRPNDAETWIFNPVSALDSQALIDVMNQGEDGVNSVRRYLNDVMGKFFPEDL